MPYDQLCKHCPYQNQTHLIGSSYQSARLNPPIDLEDNQSTVLLVFQAPGINEWSVGQAIQSVQSNNRTAGSRIAASWQRKNRKRTDFDIINVVRCFPGRSSSTLRDLSPCAQAKVDCAQKLSSDLGSRTYSEIIAFGNVAKDAVSKIIPTLSYSPTYTPCRHPSGGCSNAALDNLW